MKIDSKISLNGSIITSVPLKNRPRIPTPDVSKEGAEKENRFNLTPTITTTHPSFNITGHQSNGPSTVASGVTLMAQQLPTSTVYTGMNGNDVPVLGTLFLSPINELDSGSVHNTLQAGSPTTNALANAVLPATLQANTDWRGNNFMLLTFLSMHFLMLTYLSTAITNSPSLTRISLSNGTTGSTTNIPVSVSMVFPTSIVPTSNASDDRMSTTTVQPQDILSVAIASVPVTIPAYQTHPPSSASPDSDMSNNESNVVITEVSDRDSPEEDDIVDVKTLPMNRRNSISKSLTKEFLSRKVSDGTHSIDSPNLPKRNQPITSSAPITLTKSKADEKNEVYV